MTRRLETRLLHYFLLITFAAILIGVEFYFEMSRSDLWQEICAPALTACPAPERIIEGQMDAHSLERLRNKIVIMFGVLTIVVAIVLMMFIKNITAPLQRMVNVVNKINQGDLSQEIEVQSKDEIGQVGATINELATNLQEVAAFTTTTTRDVLDKLDACIAATEAAQGAPTAELQEIRDDLTSLLGFVESFKLR
jgi:methyl-accepting chemotaxis protein